MALSYATSCCPKRMIYILSAFHISHIYSSFFLFREMIRDLRTKIIHYPDLERTCVNNPSLDTLFFYHSFFHTKKKKLLNSLKIIKMYCKHFTRSHELSSVIIICEWKISIFIKQTLQFICFLRN